MNQWIKFFVFAILVLAPRLFAATDRPVASQDTNTLEILAVFVDGSSISPGPAGKVNLGPYPKNISFNYGPGVNSRHVPVRLHYRLDGYDTAWHEGAGDMNLTVRFYNEKGDQVGQNIFTINGESAGWNGSLKTSQLTHRRETLVVPPQASRLLVVISSAGGPAAVGIYVVENLVVSRLGPDNEPKVLLQLPFDTSPKVYGDDYQPEGWIHDGIRPSMAKIVEVGQDPATPAFAILDNDPSSHAEWHNTMDSAPKVSPGDHLVVEWNEMYSTGLGGSGFAIYNILPAGRYRFHVEELTATGVSTGNEAALAVIVPQPFWHGPWFLGAFFLAALALTMAVARYVVWQRMQREMMHLKNQRALEQERLRIAHDIHDDLGARVTQISMVSAMAQGNRGLPDAARDDFNQITKMSRDLVSALYETVWAVNPENDNLDALGSYLCQMVNQLCEQAQLGCRLHVQELPELPVSSQVRHNITLAVKESLHNVIKHARATEVVVHVTFENSLLAISIQDNGRGFQAAGKFSGNGLKSIRRRLESTGGSCFIESRPGEGATVRLHLLIRPAPAP